jgi:hypothetical protein
MREMLRVRGDDGIIGGIMAPFRANKAREEKIAIFMRLLVLGGTHLCWEINEAHREISFG